jgi:hypothetical protein
MKFPRLPCHLLSFILTSENGQPACAPHLGAFYLQLHNAGRTSSPSMHSSTNQLLMYL